MLVGARGIQITSLDELVRVANGVWRSGLAPKSFKSMDQVLVAMMHGMEVGLGPMTSVRGIAVVNGQPQLWGDVALALVRMSPKFDTIDEWYEAEGKRIDRPLPAPTSASYTAVCRITQRGAIQTERSFSIGEAQKAGLMEKETYRTYINRMLLRRARGYAMRDALPEQFSGLTIADLESHEASQLSDEAESLNARIAEVEAQQG